MDLRDLMKLAGLSDAPAPQSNDTMDHADHDTMKKLMVILDPTATDDSMDSMDTSCGCGCGEEPCGCGVQEEVVDEWANSGDHVSGEPEQMTNGHGEMGSAVDTSLRRYLKAKGDHTTVDETVYPDVTVDELAESYASYKSGTVAEGELPPGLKAYQDKKAGKKKPEVSDDEAETEEVSEGKMKDTVIDDAENMSKEEFSKKHGKEAASEYFEESYSQGDENEEGMVSNCCGAPIMDVYQGHGRCSDCKEMASAELEESVDPLAELRKLSGISEASVAAPELETALWATLDQAYSDVSSSEEVDIVEFAEYMLEGQISEMLRTQIEATFAGEEVNTTSPLGEWIRLEVEEIREQQMRDGEDSSGEDSNIMHYVMSLLTSSAEDWTDHTASKANESATVNEAPSSSDINEFVSGYIDAATPYEEELGRDADWSEEGLADMKKDATAFYTKAEELLNSVDGEHGLAGHGVDFWLTRNGHGAGFWDRGYGDAGDKLTDLAQSFGEANIYLGDDNMIYTESTGSSTQESVDTDLDGAIKAAGGDVNSPEAKEIKNRFGK